MNLRISCTVPAPLRDASRRQWAWWGCVTCRGHRTWFVSGVLYSSWYPNRRPFSLPVGSAQLTTTSVPFSMAVMFSGEESGTVRDQRKSGYLKVPPAADAHLLHGSDMGGARNTDKSQCSDPDDRASERAERHQGRGVDVGNGRIPLLAKQLKGV